MAAHGLPGPAALVIGIAIAVLAATLNGVLVTRIKLPPFIVTLGTLSIFTAVTLIYAGGQTISLNPGTFITWTGQTIGAVGFNVTVGDLMMLLLYAVFAYVLRLTG